MVLAVVWAVVVTPNASAAPPVWKPCTDIHGAECTFVKVPLDYSGRLPGTIQIRVARRLINPGLPWIVFLSGGPGQAGAIMLKQGGAWENSAFTGKFNFLAFDQRGTGESGALDCPSLQKGNDSQQSVHECLALLGERAGLYTTQDTIDDMVRLFSKLGLSRAHLTLFGYSYGTKVALAFAREHSAHIARLILDSVINPDNDDVFVLGPFKAIATSLSQLCPNKCVGVTKHPTRDFFEVITSLEKHPRTVDVFGSTGKERKQELTATTFIRALVELDFAPAARALVASADVAALHDNFQPLGRLVFSLIGNEVHDQPVSQEEPEIGAPFPQHEAANLYSLARLLARCEETPLPWAPVGSIDLTATDLHLRRLDLRLAAVRLGLDAKRIGLPDSIIQFAVNNTLAASCIDWPGINPVRPLLKKLPFAPIPTLIFQGSEDVRTPPGESEAVAKQIPGSVRVVVIGGGHSLALDQSECARQELVKFLATATATGASSTIDCPGPELNIPPLQVLPANFHDVMPLSDVSPTVGKTLESLRATILDYLDMHAVKQSLLAIGGLYSGYVVFGESGKHATDFHNYSVIKGFAVNGRLDPTQPSPLSIHLHNKNEGSVTVTFNQEPFVNFAGTLAGEKFDLTFQLY